MIGVSLSTFVYSEAFRVRTSPSITGQTSMNFFIFCEPWALFPSLKAVRLSSRSFIPCSRDLTSEFCSSFFPARKSSR